MSSADKTHSSRLHRRYWAQQLLDAGQGWPLYGSFEWCTLRVDDPRRVAACVAAAEIYTRDWYDDLEMNLRREIEGLRRGHKLAEDQAYQESFRRSKGYTPPSQRKGFAERRAEQLDNAGPQPGDYMGDPVEWSPGGEGA